VDSSNGSGAPVVLVGCGGGFAVVATVATGVVAVAAVAVTIGGSGIEMVAEGFADAAVVVVSLELDVA
jgi:hypothetical protein